MIKIMRKYIILVVAAFLLFSTDSVGKPKLIKHGYHAYWELSENGILTISGYGEMPNFEWRRYGSNSPWSKKKEFIKEIVIEDGITSIGERSFPLCSEIISVEIPNTITSIGPCAFYCCNKLSSIQLPNDIMYIGWAAFSGCSGLTSVKIPQGVRNIREYAFAGCSGLTSITIPGSVRNIGESAFSKCINLNSVEMEDGVEEIGEECFFGCEKLLAISIPNSVKSFGNNAFAYGFEKPYTGEILCFPIRIINKMENSFKSFKGYGISPESINSYKYGIRDEDGRLILAGQRDWEIKELKGGLDVSEGYIVTEGQRTGFVSPTGKWVIPLDEKNKIKSIAILDDNYVVVTNSGTRQCFLITEKKARTLKYEFQADEINPIGGEYFKLKNKTEGTYSIIDTWGNTIIPFSRQYTYISYDEKGGEFYYKKTDYDGYCDKQGIELSSSKLLPSANTIKLRGAYDDVIRISNGEKDFYKVCRNNHYGITDLEGNLIIKVEMENITPAENGLFIYELNGFYGLVSNTGKIIVPTSRGYTSIGDYSTSQETYPYIMDGYRGEIDINGKVISKIKTDSSLTMSSLRKAFKSISQENPIDHKDGVNPPSFKFTKKEDELPKGLLYKGVYTESAQGQCLEDGGWTPGIGGSITDTLFIYEDYIIWMGLKYPYVGLANGLKTYYTDPSYQFCVDSQYNVYKETTLFMDIPFPSTTHYRYPFEKGQTMMTRYSSNSDMMNNGTHTSDFNNHSTDRQQKNMQKKWCRICHSSGKCNSCNGTGWVTRIGMGHSDYCPVCHNHDGLCVSCNGRGEWYE